MLWAAGYAVYAVYLAVAAIDGNGVGLYTDRLSQLCLWCPLYAQWHPHRHSLFAQIFHTKVETVLLLEADMVETVAVYDIVAKQKRVEIVQLAMCQGFNSFKTTKGDRHRLGKTKDAWAYKVETIVADVDIEEAVGMASDGHIVGDIRHSNRYLCRHVVILGQLVEQPQYACY